MEETVPSSEQAVQVFNEATSRDIDTSRISVCVASASSSSAEHEFQRLETTQQLANSFKEILKSFCEEQQREPRDVRPYTIDQSPNAEFVQFISLMEYPEVWTNISDLSGPGTLARFIEEESFLKKLRFYAIVAQFEDGKDLIAIRKVTPAQKPDISRWSVRAMWSESRNRYELLEEDLFLFDKEIDCLVYGDYVFIANRSKFEQVFGFDQLTWDIAQRALEQLENFDIANFEEFKSYCRSDRRKQRMLAPLAHNDADLSHVNVETAHKVLEINPDLDSIIARSGGTEMLAFDSTPGNQWHLLRFLKQTTIVTVATGAPFEVDGDMTPLR